MTAAPIRYVACHPGALVHQDHKKLGRIPDGGGHRVLGWTSESRARRAGVGYEHLEVVIDDASRLAVVVPVPDDSGHSAAFALETAAAEFAKVTILLDPAAQAASVMQLQSTSTPHRARRRSPLDVVNNVFGDHI